MARSRLSGGANTRTHGDPTGEFILLDGEEYYRIANYDRMRPFFMSIPSDADVWLFITSKGGLTAGRKDAEGALFPYETVDKLHYGHHHTGPITLFRVKRAEGPEALWRPFAPRLAERFDVRRNLYKNTIGNRLVFEEVNHDLELVFRYRWSACEELGLVRTVTCTNSGQEAVHVSVLDGLRNILPYGAPLQLQQRASSLVDAYKRCDFDPATGVAVYSLTAKILDRPEAAEELRANVVWCHGLEDRNVRLSIDGVESFRRGDPPSTETVLTGRRGNYLATAAFHVEAGASKTWHVVADVGLSHVQLAALQRRLAAPGNVGAAIETALTAASEGLRRNVASADGLQTTAQRATTAHHFANVLFNNMRGGVFASSYDVEASDFRDFVEIRNREVAERQAGFLTSLPAETTIFELISSAAKRKDADLTRLSLEYLPLTFGRRHGDPSRPWNRFFIRVRNDDGTRALNYEGNWRDIFQNWEALCASFPGFLPNVVAKFLNASTVDGFNPYRITRDGFEWEVVDPDDLWSFIGYWGDHQIIYLLKLLEALVRVSPSALDELMQQQIFCYADVPYRIEPYESLLRDPHATIRFDDERADLSGRRVESIGTDGKLHHAPDGSIDHVNLLEKLLVPALAKLSNLIADGGIWMNTQRPEWNDANNALVGNGVSMVTLCYLRRYLSFLRQRIGDANATSSISIEVVTWLRRVTAILADEGPLLASDSISDDDRKRLLDALGQAFSDYRESVYARGFSGKTDLRTNEVAALCDSALPFLDHAIRANRREDGLYHSYNLLRMGDTSIAIGRLYEMLEGQVAALSSGLLSASEAIGLVDALFASDLYRDDQASFLLYPERELPAFVDRNVVPEDRVAAVLLLQRLVETDEPSIVSKDALGVHRFNGNFSNARQVARALDRLATQSAWADDVSRDRQRVLDVFEEVFGHRAFTGRSGTMYGYEGLGCIYWHMVAKLLLAVQEITLQGAHDAQPSHLVSELARAYYRIRAGLGFEKTVAEYGALPTDPYSHTPRHAGAQQPGMTGQVKEEILTRLGELGVGIEGGVVRFRPVLLRRDEFLGGAGVYRFVDLRGAARSIDLPAGTLAFSYCQVPVIYELTDGAASIRVTCSSGAIVDVAGDRLDLETSLSLHGRTDAISRLDVSVPEDSLLHT